MRKQLLGILVPLLTFVVITIAGAADMTGKGAAKETSAALQRLEVAHSQDGLRVEFKATGKLAPKLTTLDSPARIVVDFPNTVMATAQSRISVGRDGVKDVRVGMDGQNPPSTRVVVDLDLTGGSRQHELVAGPDDEWGSDRPLPDPAAAGEPHEPRRVAQCSSRRRCVDQFDRHVLLPA